MSESSLTSLDKLADEHDLRLQKRGITQVVLVIKNGTLVDVQTAGAETTYRIITDSLTQARQIVINELVSKHLDESPTNGGDSGHDA